MDGLFDFWVFLEQWLDLLQVDWCDIEELAECFKGQIFCFFLCNQEYFKLLWEFIFIVFNGFMDFIKFVVAYYGFNLDCVIVNEFIYDEAG